MEDFFDAIRQFLVGSNAWIQERAWLRGGPHHAVLVVLLMAIGAIWQESLCVALPLVAVYGMEWMSKKTEDNATDFGFPLGVFLLWHLESPTSALLALGVGVLVWWAVVAFKPENL